MVYTSEQLDNLLERLPENITEVLSTGEIYLTAQKAQTLFSLSQAQTRMLILVASDLVTGISHINDFAERIKVECQTSEELAGRIIEFLYTELFDDIAEDIGQAYLIREAYDKELATTDATEVVETRTARQAVALAKEHQMGLSENDPLVIKAVQTIGKNYALHVDQTGMLLQEIGLVFGGELSPKDFVGNITARLAISHNLATHIAKDINDQVFEPIRVQLVDLYEKTKEQKKLGGGTDENVGYIVDLDTEDHMRIVDGKLQSVPKKDSEEISFIPSKLLTALDEEYTTKKREVLEKVTPRAWETGGNPSGGSLLAAQQIATQSTDGKTNLQDEMIFHGMPTKDQVESIRKTEKDIEQKLGVPEKKVETPVPVASLVPEKVKPAETIAPEKKAPTLSSTLKNYSLDPYREAVE